MSGLFKRMRRMKLANLQSALRKSPNLLYARSPEGHTLLIHAATLGSEEMVNYLIDQGLDMDDQENRDRETALFRASQLDRVGVVDLLLKRGANITLAQCGGWTPLMIACRLNRKKSAARLLRHGGNDLDAVNCLGWTAMWCASDSFMDRIVKDLLAAGADPTILCDWGMNALEYHQYMVTSYNEDFHRNKRNKVAQNQARKHARMAEIFQVNVHDLVG